MNQQSRPILFNTEMVKAVLSGKKTVTRRIIKPQPKGTPYPMTMSSSWPHYFGQTGYDALLRPPYWTGDILWVRETWTTVPDGAYVYRASVECPDAWKGTWKPSIHMPKDAARLFLRVTGVWAERLQDINLDPPGAENQVIREGSRYLCDFIAVWDRTIKPSDRPAYGWDANPWVWVIEFEKISKEDAKK